LLPSSDALNNWTKTRVGPGYQSQRSVALGVCIVDMGPSTQVVCGADVTDPVWHAAVDPPRVDAALYVQSRVCCVLVSKCLADPQMANPTAKFEIKEMLLENERMKTPK
jgi:hypothetical protein